MWIKITSIEQLESLYPGSLIAIYPLQGPQKDVFDESDAREVAQRLVAENDPEAKMIHTISLQRKEELHTISSAGMGNLLLDSGDVTYADIIEQGAWWIPQGL